MPTVKNNETLWTKNFIIITIINLLMYCCWQMFPSSLPIYVKTLGGSDSILGLISGASTVATIIIRPFSGNIMDKFGRKGIFIFGLILFIITTAIYTIWPIVGVIIAIRFFHGIAWGVASTASNTIAADNIPKDKMGQGMSFFSLSTIIASAITPAIALSLPINTMILTATAFVVAALAMSFLIDYPNVQRKVTDGGRSSLYEITSALPTVLMFLVTITYGAVITFVALFAAEHGVKNIGLFFTLYALGMLVTRPFLGQLIDKKGFGASVIPSAILLLISLVILSKADSLAVFLIAGGIYGIGYGALYTTLQTMSVVSAPSHRLGAANATFFTGFDGGLGVGAVISGIIAGKIGYGSMYLTMIICPILILVIYAIFSKKKKSTV